MVGVRAAAGPGAAAGVGRLEPVCSAGARGISLLCGSHLARTRGLLLSGIVPQRIPCHTDLQKLHCPPSHPVFILKSCILLCSRSWPEAQGLDLCSEKLQRGLGSSI